jgi:diguanylate cyclase (GGDEF)-like protein
LIYSNGVLAQWLNRPAEGAIAWGIEDVVRSADGGDIRQEFDRVWNGAADDADFAALLLTSSSHETPVPVHIRASAVRIGPRCYLGCVIRRTNSREATAGTHYDPLTGLADRSLVISRLATLLAGDRSADQRFAVLFIDLDDFKSVNDRFGHLVGDRVLAEVARRLEGCIRAGDQLVRYGGDEFVVLLEQVAGWEEYWPVISRIQSAVAEPITLAAGALALSASIGAAEIAPEHRIPEDLLSAADRAMYAAKRRAKALAQR